MLKSKKFSKEIVLALVIVLIISLTTPAFAAVPNGNGSEAIKLVVNGKQIEPDVKPEIIDDRVMIPVQWIAEPLGGIVEWDDATQSVLVNSSAIKITKSADDVIRLFVSGKQILPDVAPQVINGRVMVPARWAAEALGAKVGWNADTRTVTVDKTGEGYGSVREIRDKDGNLLLSLQPDELFILTTNQRIYEYSPYSREKLIGQYIRKAFPDLKYKIVHWGDFNIKEEDFVRNGVYPDLYLEMANRNTTRLVKTYGMEYDLTSLIKKYNFDTTRLNKASMNLVKDRGTGAIYSLPFEINDYIMYYNKKYFDKLNVDYPSFGMTYDQAFDKALNLTYQDDFSQIKGYTQHPDQYLKLNQRGLIPFSQTEPNKIEIANKQYLDVANNISRFYEITGNVYSSTDDFLRKGIAAMCVDSIEKLSNISLVKEYIGYDYLYNQWSGIVKDMDLTNWDISTVPVFADAPNTIYQPNVITWFIPKQSQMKDTAFKVIANLLTDEVQFGRAKDGLKGSVKTDEIAVSFGVNVPEYKNLNLKAVYWGENAVPPVRSPEVAGGGYWDISLWDVFRKYIFQDGLSTDAALQRVEEEQNQYIQNQIAAGNKWS